MKIGILAVQGAFIEHEKMIESLGAEPFEIRQLNDLSTPMDGLILPGGESTVQGKLLKELGLFLPLLNQIYAGLPVLGTCAGLILLAKQLSNDDNSYFGTLPVTVRRNAYGRQLGSFTTDGYVEHVGTIPMTFIRAPYIETTHEHVEILAKINETIVGVRYENQIGIAFHPEVTKCTKLHEYFLQVVKNQYNKAPLCSK